jgi:hypothetical protein
MLKRLGDEFEAAEHAFSAVESDGVTPSDFDFEDADGRLQHRSDDCPLCVFHAMCSAYFGAIRVPVLRHRDKLLNQKSRADDDQLLQKLFAAREAAQAHLASLRAVGSNLRTEREFCDAQAAEELAESNYDIVLDRWTQRMEKQARQRRNRVLRERADREAGIVRFPSHRKQTVRPHDNNKNEK